MRRLLLVAVVALVVAPGAHAKSCARVSVVPSHAMAGQAVRIALTTWMPSWLPGGNVRLVERLEIRPGARIRVVATPSEGTPLKIRLRRDPQRPWRAIGSFMPSAGTWNLVGEAWQNAPRACAGRVRLVVRARTT